MFPKILDGAEVMYKIVGYYICEKLDIPSFLGIKGDEFISVSSCFSGIHSDLTYCYFINNRKKERLEYHEKWNITEEKAIKLQKDIHSMFENCLAIDGRFLNLADAKKSVKNILIQIIAWLLVYRQ